MRKIVWNGAKAAIDLATLSFAIALSIAICSDDASQGAAPFGALPVAVALQYGLLSAFGVLRCPWGYTSFREIVRIFGALACAAALLGLGWMLAARGAGAEGLLLAPDAIVVDFALAFVGVAGVRGAVRILTERLDRSRRQASPLVPTMLVGAELVGMMIAREIANRPDLGIEPVGFLDDDPLKEGQTIHGVRVRGNTRDLVAQCLRYGAKQVLITDSRLARRDIRRIAQACEKAGLEAKIVPGVFEIVGWRANLSRIRKVVIEDLLGREPVVLDDRAIAEDLRDRVVLVTGAGGSIGAELCRQICRIGPKKLLLLEQAEGALFQIHRELVASFPSLQLVPCIADVCDAARVTAIFREHSPEAVFHAAAHKHVPMMEWNPGEAIKNNVGGTRTVADLAHAFEARQFVMISTDKAVNPTSVMGASKRLAEIYVQALSQRSRTRFVTVRFGNVLGSAGSVIPIFQEQIAKGGPVTVTHPEMRRYFMTIPEACQLVLEAGSMGKGGEIFVLDMGHPVKIVDLARDLISLSGFKPDEDIEIAFTGIRPGEKLFEELSAEAEGVDKTRHPKIFIGRLRPPAWEDVAKELTALRAFADDHGPDEVRARLCELIPEYRPVTPDGRAEGAAPKEAAGEAAARVDADRQRTAADGELATAG
ncbi:MAG TPA: nucleoside-diphosphate sugar epimerase/dehydratase [Vulgatibacter sp.]|nr:nucleoside-diphosphate sugar epimerase/dehydratase [Vulgatibacter sp.]